MPSLRQLRSNHPSLLLLDAASQLIQVGLFDGDSQPRWATSSEEAGRGLFGCIEELSPELDKIAAFVFCEGPGSILGIRTTATAIRIWNVLHDRPVYSYGSLNLVAHAINRGDVSIIADARRESWHCQKLAQPLQRLPASELTGELVMPEGFRHWSALPENLSPCSYTLSDVLPSVIDADIFSENSSPDAFMHTDPAYKTWTPRIHRAP